METWTLQEQKLSCEDNNREIHRIVSFSLSLEDKITSFQTTNSKCFRQNLDRSPYWKNTPVCLYPFRAQRSARADSDRARLPLGYCFHCRDILCSQQFHSFDLDIWPLEHSDELKGSLRSWSRMDRLVFKHPLLMFHGWGRSHSPNKQQATRGILARFTTVLSHFNSYCERKIVFNTK